VHTETTLGGGVDDADGGGDDARGELSSSLIAMHRFRAGHSLGVLNGYLYAVGGFSPVLVVDDAAHYASRFHGRQVAKFDGRLAADVNAIWRNGGDTGVCDPSPNHVGTGISDSSHAASSLIVPVSEVWRMRILKAADVK
jgi:hypothetical protein